MKLGAIKGGREYSSRGAISLKYAGVLFSPRECLRVVAATAPAEEGTERRVRLRSVRCEEENDDGGARGGGVEGEG